MELQAGSVAGFDTKPISPGFSVLEIKFRPQPDIKSESQLPVVSTEVCPGCVSDAVNLFILVETLLGRHFREQTELNAYSPYVCVCWTVLDRKTNALYMLTMTILIKFFKSITLADKTYIHTGRVLNPNI